MRFVLKTLLFFSCFNVFAQLEEGFVYVTDEIPSIKVELRYFSENNFVGQKIEGYNSNVVILSHEATKTLKKVQSELLKDSLSLKIFDAYRPQRAVNHFRKWARNVNDTLTKQDFYPKVKKKNLFKEGYISTHSRHSSGSTLDITVVDLKTCKELDMGTAYDHFGKESHTFYGGITQKQKANRMFLKTVMSKHGFRNYPQEWWHFTLRGEPFLNQYFDFAVE
ncbi:MAG: peptidase M15 [Lutibacter sp.]|nr:MAG: peptidase M15 [Lutibacter sp.]